MVHPLSSFLDFNYSCNVFIHLYFSKKTSMQTAGRTFTARRLDENSASYWQIRSQLPSLLETGYFVARRLQRTWIYRQWQQWTRYQLHHQGKIQKRSLSTPRSYSSGTQEKGLFLLLNALKIWSWWFICATINLQIGRISKSLKTVLNTVEPILFLDLFRAFFGSEKRLLNLLILLNHRVVLATTVEWLQLI